jgi:hypothetical protein
VLNASIKSGTNQIHGDLWEYVRNTRFDGQDWDSGGGVPAYHENQFGATLGLPIWRNKIFYFADAEANRITFALPDPGITVPTPLMRQGNFTELFNSALTGKSTGVAIFAPNSAGYYPLTCTQSTVAAAPAPGIGIAGNCKTTTNILCPGNPPAAGGGGTGQMDTIASSLLGLFPMPNTNGWNASTLAAGVGGNTYANYNVNLPLKNDTWQWDQRLDWNISAKDQTYVRYSYAHNQSTNTPPLGPILDGGAAGGFLGSFDFNLGQGFMLSETHLFNPKFIKLHYPGSNSCSRSRWRAFWLRPDYRSQWRPPLVHSVGHRQFRRAQGPSVHRASKRIPDPRQRDEDMEGPFSEVRYTTREYSRIHKSAVLRAWH